MQNPFIGMAPAEASIIFELYGEAGERYKFTFDDDVALALAVEMLGAGLELMRRIKEVGLDQALYEFDIDLEPEV